MAPESAKMLQQVQKLYQAPAWKAAQQQLKKLREQRMELLHELPEVMVMEEMPEPRATYVLNRGQYDAPMHTVSYGTPERVMAFGESYPQNRLGLAQWLSHPNHPLTARVAVNRYWQMFFGRGLVNTPQDFGSQGALPSHPELLDWLAVDFVESGWDLQHLIKQMVLSATYQQSSQGSEELMELDPENTLLARGPRYRMQAEMIRDNALLASGLLVENVGGESVKPYQPKGLWIDLGNFSPKLLYYKADTLDGMHRRSMYTFIRRTSPPPSMQAFDVGDRSVCAVSRQTTNTPMQALVLMNDPQFVEAARKLGERMLTEGGETLTAQLKYGFRRVTSRYPTPAEVEVFGNLYDEEYTKFKDAPKEADELLSVGILPRDEKLDQSQAAAMTMVASMMLNHDEAYMKR